MVCLCVCVGGRRGLSCVVCLCFVRMVLSVRLSAFVCLGQHYLVTTWRLPHRSCPFARFSAAGPGNASSNNILSELALSGPAADNRANRRAR